MLIGIIGAPNKGKSSLFSALTMNEVKIANETNYIFIFFYGKLFKFIAANNNVKR